MKKREKAPGHYRLLGWMSSSIELQAGLGIPWCVSSDVCFSTRDSSGRPPPSPPVVLLVSCLRSWLPRTISDGLMSIPRLGSSLSRPKQPWVAPKAALPTCVSNESMSSAA